MTRAGSVAIVVLILLCAAYSHERALKTNVIGYESNRHVDGNARRVDSKNLSSGFLAPNWLRKKEGRHLSGDSRVNSRNPRIDQHHIVSVLVYLGPINRSSISRYRKARRKRHHGSTKASEHGGGCGGDV